MKLSFINFAIISVALHCANAWPQSLDIKIGLWEGSMSSQESAPAPIDASKMMSGLDAEQRARVEAVLKRQQARRAAEGDGPRTKIRTNKFCITKEKLDKKDFADLGPGKGDKGMTCTHQLLENTSSRVHLKMECSGESQGVVDVMYEVVNKESMKTTFAMEAKQGAHSFFNKGTGTARWIAADCGNVK